MRGGDVFMDSLTTHGVECIFGNPGTTENPVLDRLADHGIEYYVALHEGVAVGAASFYAQASGKTGIVNLHVAPGLGNGIGMMYGALKACSPMIVTAGQQDSRMRLRDPLLGGDLVEMASSVTKWSVEPASADEIGPIMRRAFKIAHDPPEGPVFVALPVNVMEDETTVAASSSGNLARFPPADPQAIDSLVSMLLEAERPIVVVGDDVARRSANVALERLVEQIGIPVYHEPLRTQLSISNRHPSYSGRIPLETEGLQRLFADRDVVLLIGGPFFEELWFSPGELFGSSTRVVQLESAHERLARNFGLDLGLVGDLRAMLESLVEGYAARSSEPAAEAAQARAARLVSESGAARVAAAERLSAHEGDRPMAPAVAVDEIARALPDDVIVVDETITAYLEVGARLDLTTAGDYYGGRGGGIGQGIAGAIGVQVAAPSRPVVALTGDGSAMYSCQALWTAAHHSLPIVFVIFSNREYRVLKHNLDIYRKRFGITSEKPYPHMDLSGPHIDFPGLAKSLGVEAEQVEEPGGIGPALERAFASGAPRLVEIVIAGLET